MGENFAEMMRTRVENRSAGGNESECEVELDRVIIRPPGAFLPWTHLRQRQEVHRVPQRSRMTRSHL